MNTERIEEIQKETAYPDSISVQQALLKVWYECEQEKAVKNNAVLPHISTHFSPKQMAEWFHNNYEEIAKSEGWQTQDNCKVEFKDLPENNRTTMIKVCERWLNDNRREQLIAFAQWLAREEEYGKDGSVGTVDAYLESN